MGFGIAFLGYCFLLLHSAGLGAVGAPLLAYGFFLAGRLDPYFYVSSVSALFMLPRGVFVLLDIFLPYFGWEGGLSAPHPWWNLATYLLFFIAWLFTVCGHCAAVKRIALSCEHVKLQRSASRQMYLSAVFIFFAVSMIICQSVIDNAQLLLIAYLAYYVTLLTNLWFTHTCLVLITSEKQYEKDKEYVAEQDRLAAERKAKDLEKERERKTRYGRNKKK